MTYSDQHLRVTLIYGINSTSEVGETSFRITTPSGFDGPGFMSAGAGFGGDVITALAASGDAARRCAYSTLLGVKVSPINTDGTLTAAPETTAASVAGTVSATQPLQITPVVTLWSGSTFGVANYGRMYLPFTVINYSSSSSYTYQTASVAALATNMAGFFADVKTAAQSVTGFTDADVYIMSNKGSGSKKPLAFVRVGNLPDTQRRRRNRVSEVYQQVSA